MLSPRDLASIVLVTGLSSAATGGSPQDPAPEPRWFTPFAQQFLGKSDLIVIAEVKSVARIGVTEKVVTEIEVTEVLLGEAHVSRFPVLTDLGHGVVRGSRCLLFLQRTAGTRQFWAQGCVRQDERNYTDKLSLVKDYLEVQGLEASQRFPKVLEHLERRLRAGRSWARWNALRELADLVVAFPERIDENRIRRWAAAFEESPTWRDTVRRLEQEWRKARSEEK